MRLGHHLVGGYVRYISPYIIIIIIAIHCILYGQHVEKKYPSTGYLMMGIINDKG